MESNLAELEISNPSSSEDIEALAAIPDTPPPEEAQPTAKLYEYEPLEPGEIRLLLLIEGDGDDDDLECALIHFELLEAVDYTALSYMRQIYESATQTVVYLGGQTGGNTGYSAWNFLERNSTWALNGRGEKDYTLPADIEDLVDFRGELYDVYLDVLARDWFSRVWVLQEVVVSREVIIQCGSRGVAWDDFCKLVVLEKRAHDRYGLSLQQQDLSDNLRRVWQARVAFHLAKCQMSYLPNWYVQTFTVHDATTDILDILVRARHLMA
ncbi:HET domain-containing protein [Fusarium sp. LHS14.1]|nr:HET domain-containing protein [Fusarium sp. LHS14.1]